MSNENISPKVEVRWYGYLALALAICFFSGIFMNASGAWRVLDFSNILGEFGKLGTLTPEAGKLASNFKGVGGIGIREAFLLAFSIIPSIMFALGVITIIEAFDGFKAAEKLLTPLMRIIFGLPGSLGICIIANLQSSDTSAMIVRDLFDTNGINEKERLIITSYIFPAPATVINYFSIGSIMFPHLTIAISLPLVVMLVSKIIGCNILRLVINKIIKDEKKEKENINEQ